MQAQRVYPSIICTNGLFASNMLGKKLSALLWLLYSWVSRSAMIFQKFLAVQLTELQHSTWKQDGTAQPCAFRGSESGTNDMYHMLP